MKKLLLLLFPLIISAQVIDTVIRFTEEPSNLLYIPQGNELYVNFVRRNYLAVLDCSTYQIKKVIPTGGSFPSAAYGTWNWRRDKIYYAFGIDPADIMVIDNRTDSIIKRINFGATWPMCYNSRDDKIYAVSLTSVAVIDCETDSIIKIVSQPYQLCYFVLWDSIGNKVYCGSAWTDKVTVINCANDSIIAVIRSGLPEPMGAGYNSQRRKVYVAGEYGHGFVIDATADTVIANYHFPFYEWYEEIPLICNSLEDKIYWLGGEIGDTLRIINCMTDSVIKIIALGYPINDMCLVPWSNRLYLACYDGSDSLGYFFIIDCRNDSIIALMRFGHNFISIDYNSFDHLIYVSDMDDRALYVIRDNIPGIEERSTLNAERFTPEIYPNPAKSFLAIRLPRTADRQVLKIYDVSGKLINKVTSTQENKEEMRISLKGINTGIYFMQLGTEIRKFLIIE
jgi:hypothetical protein